MVAKKTEYGSGPLFRVAGTVAGVMMGSILLVAANALLLLVPLLGFQPLLLILACIPVGPAVVAAMYAFNRLLAGQDTGVFRDFVRGYRRNAGQALLVWLPYLAVLAVVGFNLLVLPAGDAAAPVAGGARIGLVGLGLLVLTAAATALLLLSRFTFRVRDLYRLSLYSIGARKRVSLGNAGILFVAGFLLLISTAYLLPVIAGAVVFLVCLNSRPLLAFIEGKFTAHQ